MSDLFAYVNISMHKIQAFVQVPDLDSWTNPSMIIELSRMLALYNFVFSHIRDFSKVKAKAVEIMTSPNNFYP